MKILVLRRDSFFRDQLREAADVPVACLETRNRAHLAVRVRRAIRSERPDAVISFLSWPNLLVELAGLPRRSFAVIVSERNLDVSPRSIKSRLRYFFHRFADVVVSNSYAQRDCMSDLSSYLASRTTVIVNGVDSDRFAPRLRQEVPGKRHTDSRPRPFRSAEERHSIHTSREHRALSESGRACDGRLVRKDSG